MGLDMYLNGKEFLWTNWENPEKNKKIDGFRLKERILELGYWRKHPDLHGFIVQNFANNTDNCEPIELTTENLVDILNAVKEDKLPHTKGFFFGESQPEYKKETIEILEKAIKWLETKKEGIAKNIIYKTSW